MHNKVECPVFRSPPNLHRIRYYGFQNKHSSLNIDFVRMLVWFFLGRNYVLARREVPPEPPPQPTVCSECGGPLSLVLITDHIGRVVYRVPARAPPPPDSC